MLEGQGVIELGEVSHHGELVRPGRRDQVLHLQQRRDAETLISHAECQAQVPEKLEREVNRHNADNGMSSSHWMSSKPT